MVSFNWTAPQESFDEVSFFAAFLRGWQWLLPLQSKGKYGSIWILAFTCIVQSIFFFFFWSCVYLCCPDLIYIAKFYSGILLLSNLLCSCLFLLLKTTFEDVFPAEATSIEEYLQQVSFMQFSLILSSLADKFYSRSYWVIYEMLAEISISYFLLLEDLAGSVLLVVWLFIYVLCCC